MFSIGGGLMLLGYALYRRDPVFIIGQAFGVFVYLRNLQFVVARQRARARRLNYLAAAIAAKPRSEIGDQVARIFQPDMEAQRRPARRPLASRCDTRRSRTRITRLSKPPQE